MGDRQVDLVWDLSRARFPLSGFPEPSLGNFVTMVMDGKMVVIVGDMAGKAYRKTKAR
jgi:hypothetical protein